MSERRIRITQGQERLAWVWFAGSGLAFVLMLVETMGPRAPLPAQTAWQWFLPLVVPTLSLMLGTIVFQGRGEPVKDTIDRSVYTISLWLSALYLLLLVVLLAAWPFLRLRQEEAVQLLDRSKAWLPAVQGLVGIALGAFFVSKREK